jgi:hypothetical protein
MTWQFSYHSRLEGKAKGGAQVCAAGAAAARRAKRPVGAGKSQGEQGSNVLRQAAVALLDEHKSV